MPAYFICMNVLIIFTVMCFLLTDLALNRHLSSLPEPPMMRDNLKKEIMLFVEMLQQKNNSR